MLSFFAVSMLFLGLLLIQLSLDVHAFGVQPLRSSRQLPAFTSPSTAHGLPHKAERRISSSSSSLNMIFDPTSILIATVDSDIANVPTNEFAPIFAGGIAVMFGGLLSAIIVGTILEKKNLYAEVAAESYIQASDKEEFWKRMSDEEKKKAELMLSKIEQAKKKGITDPKELQQTVLQAVEQEQGQSSNAKSEKEAEETTRATNNSPSTASTPTAKKQQEVAKVSGDIFTDYD